MTNPAPAPQDPASSATDEAPDPFILRAERRLRLLEELTEIGMALTRALKPEAEARQEPSDDKAQAKGRDPADAYARLSRAVRLTLALETRTDQQLRDLKAGIIRGREDERAEAAERAAHVDRSVRRAEVCYLVENLADTEIEDEDEWENFSAALEERLDDDEAYEDLDKWPLRETVERLCKDLGLSPDPSRFAGEDWSVDDANGRSFFSPFRRPSRIPLITPCPRPPLIEPPSGRLQPAHHLE